MTMKHIITVSNIMTLVLFVLCITPVSGAVAIQMGPILQDTLGSEITGFATDAACNLIAATTSDELLVYGVPQGLTWYASISGIVQDSVSVSVDGTSIGLLRVDGGTTYLVRTSALSWTPTYTAVPDADHYELDPTTESLAGWNGTAAHFLNWTGSLIRDTTVEEILSNTTYWPNSTGTQIASARYRGGNFWVSPDARPYPDPDQYSRQIGIYNPADNVTTCHTAVPTVVRQGGDRRIIMDQTGSYAWVWMAEPWGINYYPILYGLNSYQYAPELISLAPTLPWDLSWSGTWSIYGSGPTVSFLSSTTAAGSFSTGGTISSVSMAPSGLYAYSASQDGLIYVYSRLESDSWYLAGTVAVPAVPDEIVTSLPGTRIAYAVGSSFRVLEGQEEIVPLQATILIAINGIPAPGAVVSVYQGGVEIGRPIADSTGRIAVTMVPGQTYTFLYEDQTYDIVARSGVVEYTWSLWVAPRSGSYYYQARVIGDDVRVGFADWRNVVTRIEVSLYDRDGILIDSDAVNASAISAAFWGAASGTDIVEIRTYTGDEGTTPDLRNRQVIVRPGALGVAGLPISSEMMQFLVIVALIGIGGAFSYVAGPVGALATAIAAIGFWALGWLNIPIAILAAAVVVAALGVFVRGAKDL